MNGTNVQRIFRTFSCLIRHPNYIKRYLTALPYWQKTPMDFGLPWYSFGAIDFLDNYLTKDMTVFEYGGGGSTIFFAERVKQVICVESSHEWADSLEEAIGKNHYTNVKVLRNLFDPSDKLAFRKSDYLNCVNEYNADVYVIDGYEQSDPLRPYCFEKVEKQIKPGNLIILDDSWRYDVVLKKHCANKMEIFQSVGPCRYGVTSTDVYFY